MTCASRLQGLLHLVGMVLLAHGLSACQAGLAKIVTDLAPIQQVEAPFGDYADVAWWSNDQLVVGYEPDPSEGKPILDLWVMRIDGSDLYKLNLPADTQHQCLRTWYGEPIKLLDGRLVFERRCSTGRGAHDQIVVWDPQTMMSQLLFNYDMPISAGGRFAFAPDLSRGVMASDSALDDQIYWLNPESPSLLDMGLARANRPAWSPDGQFIAFFGNEQMPGSAGPHWALQPYDLWLVPANCDTDSRGCAQVNRRLVSNIRNAVNVSWSPNGKWLAFDGELQDREQGIWVMQMETGVVYQVAAGDYLQPEWSPDGQRIVVNGPSEKGYRPTLFILDVSEVVNEGSDRLP